MSSNDDPVQFEHVDSKGGRVSKVVSLFRSLFDPIDAIGLIIFRILYGVLLTYEAFTFVADDSFKLRISFFQGSVSFRYYGFEWVPLCSLLTATCIGYAMMVAGIFITIGFLYRTSMVVYTIGFAYFFLLNATHYLNHFYLMIILNHILFLSPLNVAWSVDALLSPSIRSMTIPRWPLVLILAQLTLVYTFAGIVKVNPDWLRAEPILHWLGDRSGYYDGLVSFLKYEVTAYLFAYGGILFDLFVCPMLLYPPTRPVALLLSVLFHVANHFLFEIGIFPWMMLAATTLFLPPSWPRILFRQPPPDPLSSVRRHIVSDEANEQMEANLPAVKNRAEEPQETTGPANVNATSAPSLSPSHRVRLHRPLSQAKILFILLAVLFFTQQIVMPLRHLQYQDSVDWTEYGHNFAWRMKLREKVCSANFTLKSTPGSEARVINPSRVMSLKEFRIMKTCPDLLLQFAHQLARAAASPDQPPPEVYADIVCQFNYRPAQQFVDPTVNLAAVDLWAWPYPFVVDLLPMQPQLLEDYPWNMPWQRLIEMVALRRQFEENTRKTIKMTNHQQLDFVAWRNPLKEMAMKRMQKGNHLSKN